MNQFNTGWTAAVHPSNIALVIVAGLLFGALAMAMEFVMGGRGNPATIALRSLGLLELLQLVTQIGNWLDGVDTAYRDGGHLGYAFLCLLTALSAGAGAALVRAFCHSWRPE